MDKFVIRGGNPLLGTIRVSGAKNSALPCMAAAILTEDEVVLENIPQVRDIETERKLLTSMGAEVELGYGRAQHRTTISCRVLSDPTAKYEIVKTMRASSLVLGPLVARCGLARVAQPGGCAIGDRPIDLHLKGLEAMGATIVQEHGYLEARAERLHGAHIVFDKITVTGTEDLLMAAVLAEGDTLTERELAGPGPPRNGRQAGGQRWSAGRRRALRHWARAVHLAARGGYVNPTSWGATSLHPGASRRSIPSRVREGPANLGRCAPRECKTVPSFRGACALAQANPESRSFSSALQHIWIPGSRRRGAPRNDERVAV